MTTATVTAQNPHAITTTAEAETVITHLSDVMDTLLAVVEEETELVRAGKLATAAQLEPTKQELSQHFLADSARVSASHAYLAQTMPEVLALLLHRHEQFRALLQINLTVLATAHAVSESIMRGVSNELARKAAPQGYGASGRSLKPGPSSLQPLTVSRML
jgi:hypothetical protein